jgi:hypothetical protein
MFQVTLVDFNEICVFVDTDFFCRAFLAAGTLRIEFHCVSKIMAIYETTVSASVPDLIQIL